MTLTVIFFFMPPALNVTFALPVFFLAVIVKAAAPFSSVVLLDVLMLIRFFPARLTFADTFLFATGQPPTSVTVTVTTLFSSFKSSKSPVSVSTVFAFPSHPEGVGVGVGVTMGDGDGVGVSGGVGLGVSTGVGVGDGVGVGVTDTHNTRPLTCTGILLSVFVPSPNCPQSFNPHAQTVPSDFTARLWFPAAMAMASLMPLTWTGILLLVLVPSPNCPYKFLPHVQTVPSDFSATLLDHPAETFRIDDVGVGDGVGVGVTDTHNTRPLTCTGILLSVFVPSPNCPRSFNPHAQTVQSDFTARLWYPPATSMASLMPLTWKGILLSLLVPSPNCP